MTSDDRCTCCDLPTAWCGRQAEKTRTSTERAELATLLAEPGVIAARWTSKCRRCGDTIRPGDAIRPALDGPPDIGQPPWVHADVKECR